MESACLLILPIYLVVCVYHDFHLSSKLSFVILDNICHSESKSAKDAPLTLYLCLVAILSIHGIPGLLTELSSTLGVRIPEV